jgi:hypothetical protein
LKDHEIEFSEADDTYFTRALQQPMKVFQFNGTPKVHKNKFPTSFHPVIAQCGSLSAIISSFIDYKLQPYTKKMPSYILNSTHLLNKLDSISNLPKGSKLFTSNAISMYTIIDPEEGISVIRQYLNK